MADDGYRRLAHPRVHGAVARSGSPARNRAALRSGSQAGARVKTLRRHAITGEEILFAPQRASRRGAFLSSGAESRDLTGGDDDDTERCPFCPGHETDTPAEIARIGDGTNWTARVFP